MATTVQPVVEDIGRNDNPGPEVLYAVTEHVATITLNRPDRMNTISRGMLDQLTRALLTADADPDVRVVILTGTGRAFCAGLDLTEADASRGLERHHDGRRRRHRPGSQKHPANSSFQHGQARPFAP